MTTTLQLWPFLFIVVEQIDYVGLIDFSVGH